MRDEWLSLIIESNQAATFLGTTIEYSTEFNTTWTPVTGAIITATSITIDATVLPQLAIMEVANYGSIYI